MNEIPRVRHMAPCTHTYPGRLWFNRNLGWGRDRVDSSRGPGPTGPRPGQSGRRPGQRRSWWRLSVRFVARNGLRAFAESLYLLTAPVIAAAGVVVVVGGLGAGTIVSLVPGRPRVAARLSAWFLRPARRFAELERWRIGRLRSLVGGTKTIERPHGTAPSASDPELWLDVAHAVALFPVILVTWSPGCGGSSGWRPSPPRCADQFTTAGSLRPMTLYAGSAQSHIALSLGLTRRTGGSPSGPVGLVVLVTLPLVTHACVAAQAGLGQALLSDASALHRRITGLEQERDAARARTVAAVTAEAAALRRLERDLHDGPQQRLVRLALELGRAQHHFDRRPEAVTGGAGRSARPGPGGAGRAPGAVARHRPADPGGPGSAGGAQPRWPRAVPCPSNSSDAAVDGRSGRRHRDGRVLRRRRGADQRGQAQPRPPVRHRPAPRPRKDAAGLGDRRRRGRRGAGEGARPAGPGGPAAGRRRPTTGRSPEDGPTTISAVLPCR